jgi:hypothetical protein
MVYSDLPYPIYPWIRFVVFQPDCRSRFDNDTTTTIISSSSSSSTAIDEYDDRAIDCGDDNAHFLVDYDYRKIRSRRPIDWEVVIMREINVATIGMQQYIPENLKSAQRILGRCLACCLARRGS